MAVASPPQALASIAAQRFNFRPRNRIRLQVRFYGDANATAGAELPIADGGTRVLAVRVLTQVVDYTRDYQQYDPVLSALDQGSTMVSGATWYAFDLISSTVAVSVIASDGANPAAAQSYRIWIDVEANDAP